MMAVAKPTIMDRRSSCLLSTKPSSGSRAISKSTCPRVYDTVCEAAWSSGRLLRGITHFPRPNQLQEPGMAQNKKATKEVDEVLPYLEGVAKSLVDRLYGPAGPAWGTKFIELEETVATIRQALTERML